MSVEKRLNSESANLHKLKLEKEFHNWIKTSDGLSEEEMNSIELEGKKHRTFTSQHILQVDEYSLHQKKVK